MKKLFCIRFVLALCTAWHPISHALDLGLLQQTTPAPVPITSLATKQALSDTSTVTFERSYWQLSEAEWQRYLELMRGIRGSVSPKNLSPLEVLGIHAETDAERNRYAKMWAKMYHEDIMRTLKFQLAYSAAEKELFGGPTVSPALKDLITKPEKIQHLYVEDPLVDDDRLLVFLKVSGCQQCTVVLEQVLAASASKKVQVDLYFTDTREGQDDALIINWARTRHLDQNRVQQKTLTLNYDNGAYYKVTRQLLAEVPAVYVLRNNQLFKWTQQ